MILSYIKIALRVLMRRKFFSFVSLFGISFTLMVLMVLVAMIDHIISPNTPDTERDRNLYILQTRLENKAGTENSNNPASFHLLIDYVKKLKTPERISLFKLPEVYNAFNKNQKFALDTRFTDAEYWEVLHFNFIEGRPFTNKELANKEPVAIISKSTSDNYFGKGQSVTGREIIANNVAYRVLGVVEDVPPTNLHAFGDLYLPYSIASVDFTQEKSLRGSFFCIVQAKSTSDFPAIRAEFRQVINSIDIKAYYDNYDILFVNLDTYLSSFTRATFGSHKNDKQYMFFMVIGSFMLLFMLLPAINLVNLNITRMMERASEIGVRKAFGASNGSLVRQMLVENIIITIIGGVISFILTLIVLNILNASQIIPHSDLALNLNIFTIGFSLILLFGILSGVYPAFKMSRMQAASVLRGGGNG